MEIFLTQQVSELEIETENWSLQPKAGDLTSMQEDVIAKCGQEIVIAGKRDMNTFSELQNIKMSIS